MFISRLMRQFAAACALMAAATAASAAIVVIDFDDIGGIRIDSYSESGYIFTSLAIEGGPHLHPGSGNLWLHSQGGSSPYQFRREDGMNFDLLGFEYLGGDSVFIADTGARFEILGEVPLTHVELPASFQNVNYVNWYMNTPNPDDLFGEQWGRIDNIVTRVLPVPEPAHAGMLGLGLAAVLAAARRARKQ